MTGPAQSKTNEDDMATPQGHQSNTGIVEHKVTLAASAAPTDAKTEGPKDKKTKIDPSSSIPTYEYACAIMGLAAFGTPSTSEEAAACKAIADKAILEKLAADSKAVKGSFSKISESLGGSTELSNAHRQVLCRMRDSLYGMLPAIPDIDFTNQGKIKESINTVVPTWEDYIKSLEENNVSISQETTDKLETIKKQFEAWRNAVIEERLHLYAIGVAQAQADEAEKKRKAETGLKILDTKYSLGQLSKLDDASTLRDKIFESFQKLPPGEGLEARRKEALLKVLAENTVKIHDDLYVSLDKEGKKVFTCLNLSPENIQRIIAGKQNSKELHWTHVPADKQKEVENYCLAAGKRVYFDEEETLLSKVMLTKDSKNYADWFRNVSEYDAAEESKIHFPPWASKKSLQKQLVTDVIGDNDELLKAFWSDLSQHAKEEEHKRAVSIMTPGQLAKLRKLELDRVTALSAPPAASVGSEPQIESDQELLKKAELANAREEAIVLAESHPEATAEEAKAFINATGDDPKLLRRLWDCYVTKPIYYGKEKSTEKEQGRCTEAMGWFSSAQKIAIKTQLDEDYIHNINEVKACDQRLGEINTARVRLVQSLLAITAPSASVPTKEFNEYLEKQKAFIEKLEALAKLEQDLLAAEEKLGKAKNPEPGTAKDDRVVKELEENLSKLREKVKSDRPGIEAEIDALKKGVNEAAEKVADDQEILRVTQINGQVKGLLELATERKEAMGRLATAEREAGIAASTIGTINPEKMMVSSITVTITSAKIGGGSAERIKGWMQTMCAAFSWDRPDKKVPAEKEPAKSQTLSGPQ